MKVLFSKLRSLLDQCSAPMGTGASFFGGVRPELLDAHTEYITKKFPSTTPESYKPHITIGVAEELELDAPFSFVVDRLAVC
jgi:hypothetical protein